MTRRPPITTHDHALARIDLEEESRRRWFGFLSTGEVAGLAVVALIWIAVMALVIADAFRMIMEHG